MRRKVAKPPLASPSRRQKKRRTSDRRRWRPLPKKATRRRSNLTTVPSVSMSLHELGSPVLFTTTLFFERGPARPKTDSRAATTTKPKKNNNTDILITTPLRLVFALKSNLVSLASTRHLILDEADKLFELNFLEQTDEILAACKRSAPGGEGEVRKGMFSATMPSTVEELAKGVMAGAGAGMVRAIVGHKCVFLPSFLLCKEWLTINPPGTTPTDTLSLSAPPYPFFELPPHLFVNACVTTRLQRSGDDHDRPKPPLRQPRRPQTPLPPLPHHLGPIHPSRPDLCPVDPARERARERARV